MKIPKKVKIGGHIYKVFIVERKDEKKGEVNWGKIYYDKCEIYIDNDLCDSVKMKAFIHEILHAIDCVYNNNSLKEEEIDRLSEGLYQFLKDNNIIK